MSDPEEHAELFDEFPRRLGGDRWQPAIDVFETEDAVVVRAEISGLRAEDLRVKIDRDLLRISGVRDVPPRGPAKRLLRMEIAFGPFERTVRIPVPFAREGAAAHLEDGFLEVTLPKSGPRRVEVETA